MSKSDVNANKTVTSRQVSRADVRTAMIHGYRLVKDNPRTVKITSGQRGHMTKRDATTGRVLSQKAPASSALPQKAR